MDEGVGGNSLAALVAHRGSCDMTARVRALESPSQALEIAGTFLASDPVRHNLILTLLHTRMAYPEPGRYWIVDDERTVRGVVFQSPLHFVATLTSMTPDTARSAVDAIVDAGVELPGVNGEAAPAANFAGHWTERTGCAAIPTSGQRVISAPVHGVVRIGPVYTPRGARPRIRGGARSRIVSRRARARPHVHAVHGSCQPVIERALPQDRLPRDRRVPPLPIRRRVGFNVT